jgi:4,5:9,10-diseco-3-hydroxy-5,9,17-trioxoandrosta-1(10),2-diene-4-oate hydrolase
MSEPKSQFAVSGEVSIHYTVEGSGDPVILLHGGGPGANGRSNYSRNISALAEHFTCYVIDFPGWGQSSKNLDSFGAANPFINGARAVKLFMDLVGLEKAHLIGNSYGGAVAYAIALEYPERVDRLVAMGPGGAWIEGEGMTPGIFQLLTYYTGEGPTRAKLESFLQNLVFDTSVLTPELIDERFAASNNPEITANPPLRIPPGVTGPLPREIHLSEDPRIKTLPHKVLLIWGKQDKINLPAGATSFAAVPNQQTVFFDRCGHWAQWEHADKFNTLVTEFLS